MGLLLTGGDGSLLLREWGGQKERKESPSPTVARSPLEKKIPDKAVVK